MRTPHVLAALAFATLAICDAANPQMVVSPLPWQSLGWSCGQRPEPQKPIVELDEEAVVAADQFRRVRVTGSEVRSRTQRLMSELAWHPTLRGAARVARKAKKSILWIQVLGSLKGFT